LVPRLHPGSAAGSLVYPSRISAAAPTPQLVTTYVIADGQVRHTDPTVTTTPGELRFAGPIDTGLRTSPTWDELAAAGDYLTVMDYEFDDPVRQIISDFTFASAPEAADHQEVVVQTRMRMIAGFPAGPVLLVLGVVGLVVGFVLVRHFLPAGDGGARRAPAARPVPSHPEQHYSAPR